MSTSSDKAGPRLDEELKNETEPLERSGKEAHVEEEREQQSVGHGHRVSGSGSSADSYNYQDRGEEGGASHPKPKASERPLQEK